MTPGALHKHFSPRRGKGTERSRGKGGLVSCGAEKGHRFDFMRRVPPARHFRVSWDTRAGRCCFPGPVGPGSGGSTPGRRKGGRGRR